MKKVIALLPMKGHSERVPNKNMRLFCGEPLYRKIARTLEGSESIESIVIDTDSETIAEDALSNFKKVIIHERPRSICGDMVPMNQVIKHDISLLDKDHFLQTHSTNPLLAGDTIEKAVELYFRFLDTNDSLFSVTRLQTRLYWENGKAVNHDPSILLRTQDLPPVFEENSNFYLFSRSSFELAGDQRIGRKPRMFEMDKIEAWDIDDEADFSIAEALFGRNFATDK